MISVVSFFQSEDMTCSCHSSWRHKFGQQLKSIWGDVWLPCLVFLPLLVAGCGSVGGGANEDAGATPPRDSGDRAPADASIEPGLVGITVATEGALTAGVPVIFQNQDGSTVAVLLTDSNGYASANMSPGGSIAVVQESPGYASVLYILGIEPGDNVVHGLPHPETTEHEITMPESQQQDVQYIARSKCGGSTFPFPSTPSGTFERIAGCTSGDVFILAHEDGLPFRDYGAVVAKDVDLTGENLDFSKRGYAESTPVAISLANAPETVGSAETHLAVTTPTAGIWLSSAVGESFARFDGPLTPTATSTATVPSVEGSELKAQTSILWTNQNDQTSVLTVTERAPLGSTYELDFSTIDIPAILQPASVDELGTVSWQESGTGTADWTTGSMRARRGGTTIDRQFWSPHEGTAVRIPALPSEFGNLDHNADDEIASLSVRIWNGPGGYQAYRRFAGERSYFTESLAAAGDRYATAAVLR